MMVARDHLVRHPDRCTHQAICIPVCPTGAWLSTRPLNSTLPVVWKVAGSVWMLVRHKRSTLSIEKVKTISLSQRRINLTYVVNR